MSRSGYGGAAMPLALLHHPCAGGRVSAELSTHGHIPVWRGGCQDSQDGGMGWARGLLPVPPSPNCRRGGDVGSCSTKPCSFSPLKPDYLAVPVCVRARREEEEEFHNNKCLQPHWAQLPRSRPRDSSIASAPGRLLLSLLSPWLCWSSRACVLGMLGHGRRSALGLGGGCCGSLWG